MQGGKHEAEAKREADGTTWAEAGEMPLLTGTMNQGHTRHPETEEGRGWIAKRASRRIAALSTA